MKNRVITILALCVLIIPSVAWGQAGNKVGLVNIQEAILSTGEGKKAMADLQRKYQPRQQEVQKLQQDIQAITDQLQRGANTLSDEEQRRLNRDLEEKQRVLKRTTEDAQADFNTDRDEMFRRIGQKLVKQIDDYARQNGFSLVIGSDQVPIYYAAKEIELTDEIVKLYDAANPSESPSTSGAPAKPAAKTPARPKQ